MIGYRTLSYYVLYAGVTRRQPNPKVKVDFLPRVTVQIPVFNERYVAARCIKAASNLDYPRDRLEIQVLDDSTDNTSELCRSVVERCRRQGINVQYIHRKTREAFKAGALQAGLRTASGELIAVFDADFIPPRYFLKEALQYFHSKNIGLVQTRWTHLNEEYSILTRAQAASLDYHFLIEQTGRDGSGLFLNFNGTAGIWRKEAILSAGGWQDSLAEDFDLSMRAQLMGWNLTFVPTIECPAELPVQMAAARRQQFRWAKGSAECARKYFRPLLKHSSSPFVKLNAAIQLTRHGLYVLVLVQFLLIPFLMQFQFDLAPAVSTLTQMSIAPPLHYAAVRKMYGQDANKKIRNHLLLLFHSGIMLNNARAFLEGIVGVRSEFLRTPKFGISGGRGNWRDKDYVLKWPSMAVVELLLAAYGFASMLIAIVTRNFLLMPYVALTTFGLVYVGASSIYHSIGAGKSS